LILPELTLDLAASGERTAHFDLTLLIRDSGNGLAATLEYSTDLFDEARIQRMLGHWQVLLAGIVADPEQRLADLSLLTEPERRQLTEWNDTTAPFPGKACLHQLFEAQVERSPEATAVVFETECISYGELNRRANRLANYLASLGVGPEVLVGVCLERGIEMLVGLFGVLKAGGLIYRLIMHTRANELPS